MEAWAVAGGHRWRTCLFSPLPTLLACLHKQLAPGTSCRDVEDWAASLLPPSETINAGDDFCEARKRLPETVFLHALAHTAKLCSPASVWLVDGTALTLPRSAANAGLAYPTPRRECPTRGCSSSVAQPAARSCKPISLAVTKEKCASFCVAFPTCRLAPSAIASSFLPRSVRRSAQTRLNVLRKPVKVRPQGKGDEIQTWQKPRLKSSAFPEHIARLPQFMEVRVGGVLKRKGYRSVLWSGDNAAGCGTLAGREDTGSLRVALAHRG